MQCMYILCGHIRVTATHSIVTFLKDFKQNKIGFINIFFIEYSNIQTVMIAAVSQSILGNFKEIAISKKFPHYKNLQKINT